MLLRLDSGKQAVRNTLAGSNEPLQLWSLPTLCRSESKVNERAMVGRMKTWQQPAPRGLALFTYQRHPRLARLNLDLAWESVSITEIFSQALHLPSHRQPSVILTFTVACRNKRIQVSLQFEHILKSFLTWNN